MLRLSAWTPKMQDATVRQFRNIITKEETNQKRNHAEECGFELGQALVAQGKLVEQLTKDQLEKYRRRYGVSPLYLNVMKKHAEQSRRHWLRWQETQFDEGVN